MYLGGVISGPKDGVISDRNLRTRRQNELRQNGVFNLTVAAAGPRVATRIRRSNRFSFAPHGVSEHVPHCLQWPPSGERRFSDAPAGAKVDFVSPVGSPTTLRSARPARCFVPKGHFYEAPGGGVRRQHPLRRPPKTRGFLHFGFRPLKNTRLLPSETQKTR